MAFQQPLANKPHTLIIFRQIAVDATVTEMGTAPFNDTDVKTARDDLVEEILAGTTTNVDFKQLNLNKHVAAKAFKEIFVKTENGYDFDRKSYGLVDLPAVTIT